MKVGVARTFLPLFSIWLVIVASGCKERNYAVCCTTEQDCQELGTTPEEAACQSGYTCEDNSCVPARCSSDADCSVERPFCRNDLCVECDETSGCSTVEPVCSATTSTCDPCTGNDQCTRWDGAPFCKDGSCVACLQSSDCGPDTPVCDSGSCRACVDDDDCASGACDLDGRCVPESEIAYMSDVNATDVDCTRSSPCRTFTSTIGRLNGRKHIVLTPGVYPTRQTFSGDLFIHGHGAIVSHATTSTSAAMDILGPLKIRDLTFTESGDAFAHVRIAPMSSGFVLLEGVRFTSAHRLRIDGPTVLRNAKFSASTDSTAAIVVESTGELTIEGAEIERGVVGIQATATGAKVHIKNLLVRGTSGRGLELQNATGELEFSTIAGVGATVAAAPCAVTCTSNFRVTSSIIWQETCSGNIRDAAGPCTFQSSIVSNPPAPGIMNVDPAFVNGPAGDFHISASSPAKDVLDTGPAMDFEGDARPRGTKFDIGADEAP